MRPSWTTVLVAVGLVTGFASELAAQRTSLPPTYANVSYGDHERNTLNFWKAEGLGARPLLVFIHGGDWLSGAKPDDGTAFLPFLERGISVAAIDYRYGVEDPLPAPVHDAARAIQFLRSQARRFNINTNRIAVSGVGAGGCTALWLLYHDDLADPAASDPVLRQSSYIIAAAVSNAPTSIDPKVVVDWVGPEILNHPMLWTAVGEENMESALEKYEEHSETYQEFSPINHVSLGDPPAMLIYTFLPSTPATSPEHAISHPQFGSILRRKVLDEGGEVHLIVEKGRRYGEYNTAVDFLLSKLLEEE